MAWFVGHLHLDTDIIRPPSFSLLVPVALRMWYLGVGCFVFEHSAVWTLILLLLPLVLLLAFSFPSLVA